MNRFISTQNRFTTIVLWGLAIAMPTLVYRAYRFHDLSPIAGVIIGMVSLFIFWVLVDTRYVLRNNYLLYRSGPIRGRIPVKKINAIRKHSGLFVPVTHKPALDTKGYIITYNQIDAIFISPKNAEQFLFELKKINPEIVID